MNTAIDYQNHNTASEKQAINGLSKLTEVIIPQANGSQNIIFPLVASMSQQEKRLPLQSSSKQRWLTWITDRKPSQQQLAFFGANIDTLRIIHINKHRDNRWIIWDALNNGNSHTVISDVTRLDKEDISHLENAAINGDCSGILVRSL